MTTGTKIWYNYWNPPYRGKEPSFFNPDDFEWAKLLRADWKIYEEEIKNLIKEQEDKFQSYFTSERDTGATGWKTITLMTWGIKVPHNLNKCSSLKKLIESYPQWLSASVNMLEPGTIIKEHSGDTNAIFRCHAGIEIPGKLPECGFRVKEEERSWKQGELLIFLDAHPHKAWNNTSARRIIFLFDILRPEFSRKKDSVCLHVRAFLLLQLLGEKIPLLKKIPKYFQKIIYHLIRIALQFLLPYQKKSGVIRRH